MRKIIFILIPILIVSLVSLNALDTCTPDSGGDICEQNNCGGSWDCVENCDFFSFICSYEKHISQGETCDIFESCNDCSVCIAGCNCNFNPESALMTWGDSSAVLRLSNKYPQGLQDNLFRLPSLSVLSSVAPTMFKTMMTSEYGVDLEIGQDTTVKVTKEGHLVSTKLNLDFNLNTISVKPTIELLDNGFKYNNNLIENLAAFGKSTITFESNQQSTGMNVALFGNTFDLFIPSDQATGVKGTGTKGLDIQGGNFRLNGNLGDGRNFDFSNANGEEFSVDFVTQSGTITGVPSFNIGGKDIIGTDGVVTQFYFGGTQPPIFSGGTTPQIWVGENGNVQTQGIVEFHDDENGFNYKGTGDGVIASYNQQTNKIAFTNPLGVKDIGVVTAVINGEEKVEITITNDGFGGYKFEASAHDVAGLEKYLELNMETLTIVAGVYTSYIWSTETGDIQFDIYQGNTKFDTITIKSEESATAQYKGQTVESGDSLWKIAQDLLGDGSKYGDLKIFDEKGKDITQMIQENPSLLSPGMKVTTGGIISGTTTTEIFFSALPDYSQTPIKGINSNPNPNSVTEAELTKLMEYYSQNEIGNRKCNCEDRCDEYAASIVKHSTDKGIDPVLTFSIIMQESGCDETPPPGANVGMMQIYQGSNELLNYDKNIDAGTDILKGKYDAYVDEDGKEFTCNGETVTYQEWEVAVRAYNGWGCKGGNLNYVEEVTEIYNDAKEQLV